MTELKEAIEKVWYVENAAEYLCALYSSKSKRVKNVIKAKGDTTNFQCFFYKNENFLTNFKEQTIFFELKQIEKKIGRKHNVGGKIAMSAVERNIINAVLTQNYY